MLKNGLVLFSPITTIAVIPATHYNLHRVPNLEHSTDDVGSLCDESESYPALITFLPQHPSTLFIITLACVCAMGAPACAGLALYEPANGCYVGAYIELDNRVNGDVREFQRLVGKEHASYFRYVGYGQPFPFRWVKDLQAQGIAPQIAWEPNQGLDAVKDNDYLQMANAV